MTEPELDTPDDERELWDEPDVKAQTTARPMRAWEELVSVLVDEARVHFTEYGVELRCVDPANVGMLDLDWHRDGLSGWNHPGGDVVTGMNINQLGDIAGFGRKTQDDAMTFTLLDGTARKQMGLRVTRGDERVQRSSRWFGIDPDSLRHEPDLPDNVRESYGWKARVGTKPFRDALAELKKGYDHVRFRGDDDVFVVQAEDLDAKEADDFRFPGAATCQPWDAESEEEVTEDWLANHSDDTSLFSIDYMVDMAKALHSAKMEKVTIGWGEQFPCTLKFGHEEWGIDGSYMLAPRIQKDS